MPFGSLSFSLPVQTISNYPRQHKLWMSLYTRLEGPHEVWMSPYPKLEGPRKGWMSPYPRLKGPHKAWMIPYPKFEGESVFAIPRAAQSMDEFVSPIQGATRWMSACP